MKSYTYGTTPIKEIRKALPHKYEMQLNKSDLLTILAALKDYDESAMSLRTSILETIGIEEI